MATTRRAAVWLAAIGIGAVVVIGAGCDPGGETTVPDELVGTWKTAAPAYADRALRFTRTGVVFGVDVGIENAHPIQRVMSVREQGTVLFTVIYTDRFDQTVSFYHDPANGGTITLKNQRAFQWKKEG